MMISNWREASTLILTAMKKIKDCSALDYTLLTLRRSSKSSFMPSGVVFPGGNFHLADSSSNWLDIFPEVTLRQNDTENLKEVPPIMRNIRGDLPKLLSLKITAIRETFEETGILLCRKKPESNEKKNNKNNNITWVSCCTIENLSEWRSRVQEDPTQFFSLCKHLNCFPDVENIHLWSNWLTPTSLRKKRFDTLFFLACLEESQTAAPDNSEIDRVEWSKPDELLASFKKKHVWLPPPQFYEISRLVQFVSIKNLIEFARTRKCEGCQRWMPQRVNAKDGLISLLPGDSAYAKPDYETPSEPIKVDTTAEGFRCQHDTLHRIEFVGSSVGDIVVRNYVPANGHVLPLTSSH